MTKKKAEKLYNDYQRLIYDRSWHWHERSRLGFDEMHSESLVIFMKAVEKWNPDRAGFGTFLRTCLNNGLCKFVTKTDLPSELPDLKTHTCLLDQPDEIMMSHERMNDLRRSVSEEARFILKIFISAPGEVLQTLSMTPPKMCRGVLRRHLRTEGWSFPTIARAMAELTTAVRGMERS